MLRVDSPFRASRWSLEEEKKERARQKFLAYVISLPWPCGMRRTRRVSRTNGTIRALMDRLGSLFATHLSKGDD